MPGAPPQPVPPNAPAAPWQAPAPSYLPPGASAPPAAPDIAPDREEVHWFARIGIGLGPRGMASNNALLDAIGYPSVKMWAELDGAYMFHRRIGVGLWMGMNRRSSQPKQTNPNTQPPCITTPCPTFSVEQGARLNAVSYFIGAEVPILLWGPRDYAFELVPRGGFLSGQLEIDNEEDAPFQKTGIFGGALTFNSFTYHVGASVAYTYAPVSSLSQLGRTHDYGGFYFMLQGSIDG